MAPSLCQPKISRLINTIEPDSVKKINTMKAPFKQRENIEMYLKACAAYGLKEQDLFQVNDLYENKNLYMILDNLYQLGGMVSGRMCVSWMTHCLYFRPRRRVGRDQCWASRLPVRTRGTLTRT